MNAKQRRIAAAKAGLKQALNDLAETRRDSPGIIAPRAREPTKGSKMDNFEIEMRGRLIMLEVLTTTLFAHIAAHISDPMQFTAQVMADVERNIKEALNQAGDGDAKHCAEAALHSYIVINGAMLAHINRHAEPAGRG